MNFSGPGNRAALLPLHAPDPSRLVLTQLGGSCKPYCQRFPVQHVRAAQLGDIGQYLPQGRRTPLPPGKQGPHRDRLLQPGRLVPWHEGVLYVEE